MNYEIGSLHRLRVVNFNSKTNFSELSEETCNTEDLGCLYNAKENIKPLTVNAVEADKNPACIKIKSISDTSLHIRSKSSTVNNAIKRVCGKTSFSPYKKSLNKRSISINNLKQKLSSSSMVISDRIKQTFVSVASQFSLISNKKTKVRHKRKRKMYPCNVSYSNDKLKVTRRKNCTTVFGNRKICRECRRIDLFYDSKSSGDFLGFKSNYNNRVCHHLPKRRSRKRFPACNIDYRNYRRDDECFRKTQLEGINNYKSSSYGNRNMPIYYNSVDFAHYYETVPSTEYCTRTSKFCGDETGMMDPCPCMHDMHACENKLVSVTSSCLPICENYAGECETNSHCILYPNIGIQCDLKYIKRNQDNNILLTHRDCHGCEKPYSLLTYDLYKKPVSVVKSTLKYILFGVVVIAWSPCIIILGLYLLIVYPLRPQNIFRGYCETEEFRCQCGSCFKCRFKLLHCIFRYIVRAAKRVRYAYKVAHSEIKKQKHNTRPCLPRISAHRNHRCKQSRQNYPNPKKKYVLYYSSHRGWLMKPIRKSFNKTFDGYPRNSVFEQNDCNDFENSSKVCMECECPCTIAALQPSIQALCKRTKGKVKLVKCENFKSKTHKLFNYLRICRLCQCVRKHVRETINSRKCDMCDDMFVYTLRKRPFFWTQNSFPSFYSPFLVFHRFYKNCMHALILMLSMCIWFPLLSCCYFFYAFCCRCVKY